MFFSRFTVDIPAARFFAGRCPVTELSEQEVYSLREKNMQSGEAHVRANLCAVKGFALLPGVG
ncbi:hypothetical protein EBB79_02525 [Parasedimentitalea marina]|uniref:Uncharacterized protein n=1 Tax=Parasedimentitalea marina TaxID=2483033 RepID=A0A3T0MYP1_9RHOB|nr:hypothetical protein EBB79_02525 [Parasedimentitalea marina]